MPHAAPDSATLPRASGVSASASCCALGPSQLTAQQWEALRACFAAWLDEQWRACTLGNNKSKPERVEAIISLIYQGARCREITRRVRSHSVTVARVMRHLRSFLATAPEFHAPRCACGGRIWHRGICQVWDTYHHRAITKGHETQRRMARENESTIFFQTIQQAHNMTSALITPTNTQTDAERFAALVQKGIDAWTEAGRLLVRMIEENPNAKNVIIEFCPDVTEEILSRFEAIGRNQLHPKTLLNNSPGMRRLRQLPYSDQARFLSEPVPVLVKTATGIDTLQVAVKNLTPEQALQVFTPDGVRGLDAQRAWVESRTSRKHATSAPYQIKGHKVHFNADCEMTARELAQVLAQMS